MKNADSTLPQRLEIPENIPLRWELFRGFGLPELVRSAVIVAATGIGGYVYAQLSTSPFRVLTAIVILLAAAIIAVGLFVRQSNRLSMYDYIVYAIQFSKAQKQYDNIKIEEVVLIDESQA